MESYISLDGTIFYSLSLCKKTPLGKDTPMETTNLYFPTIQKLLNRGLLK